MYLQDGITLEEVKRNPQVHVKEVNSASLRPISARSDHLKAHDHIFSYRRSSNDAIKSSSKKSKLSIKSSKKSENVRFKSKSGKNLDRPLTAGVSKKKMDFRRICTSRFDDFRKIRFGNLTPLSGASKAETGFILKDKRTKRVNRNKSMVDLDTDCWDHEKYIIPKRINDQLRFQKQMRKLNNHPVIKELITFKPRPIPKHPKQPRRNSKNKASMSPKSLLKSRWRQKAPVPKLSHVASKFPHNNCMNAKQASVQEIRQDMGDSGSSQGSRKRHIIKESYNNKEMKAIRTLQFMFRMYLRTKKRDLYTKIQQKETRPSTARSSSNKRWYKSETKKSPKSRAGKHKRNLSLEPMNENNKILNLKSGKGKFLETIEEKHKKEKEKLSMTKGKSMRKVISKGPVHFKKRKPKVTTKMFGKFINTLNIKENEEIAKTRPHYFTKMLIRA